MPDMPLGILTMARWLLLRNSNVLATSVRPPVETGSKFAVHEGPRLSVSSHLKHSNPTLSLGATRHSEYLLWLTGGSTVNLS